MAIGAGAHVPIPTRHPLATLFVTGCKRLSNRSWAPVSEVAMRIHAHVPDHAHSIDGIDHGN
ncbi:hypothetical protein BT69DRAFT_1275248, partial [Atractiella rhizophila]